MNPAVLEVAKELVCAKCGESKDPDQFHNDRTRKNGKCRICAQCVYKRRQAKKKRHYVSAETIYITIPNLREVRKQYDWSIKELAFYACCEEATIKRAERGGEIDQDIAVEIMSAFVDEKRRREGRLEL